MSAQSPRRAATRRRSAAVVLVAVALAPFGLAACAPRAGSAAYVGDQRLTASQVQSDTQEVLVAAKAAGQTGLDPAEVNRRQIDRFVTDQLIQVAAERHGVTVTDAEVDALIRQATGSNTTVAFEEQLAASEFVPPSAVYDFARTVALNQKLTPLLAPGLSSSAATTAIVSSLGALSTQLGTGVAARYGTWDPTDLTVALPPNDLSTPAAAASSAATPDDNTQVQQ